MSLFQELQRRNVIRVATAYVVVAWLIIQVVETIFPAFGFSDKAVRVVVIICRSGPSPRTGSHLQPKPLTRPGSAVILGPMNARLNRNWWWLTSKERAAG